MHYQTQKLLGIFFVIKLQTNIFNKEFLILVTTTFQT